MECLLDEILLELLYLRVRVLVPLTDVAGLPLQPQVLEVVGMGLRGFRILHLILPVIHIHYNIQYTYLPQ